MKALLQLRWLIIDEISMVSARLLADVDLKLRSYVRAADPFAHNGKNELRPSAGVNVLFSGDVWQLPPSDGGFLGDIPHELIENSEKYDPASPVISHGQSLLWSGAKTGVQGVTELTICERTADEWLRSVQEEFRFGKLQQDTHALLHGEPTLLPGSVIGKKALCRNKKCVRRCKEMLAVTGITDPEREEMAAETKRDET